MDDADGEIWLQCFPRVLGYVFNPVSFWFCERADGALCAVLCEVNNTFGERHCYLLADPAGAALPWGRELEAAKVFHVSPFCKVEGGYRFMQASGKEGGLLRTVARIDYAGTVDRIETSISGEAFSLTRAAALRAFFCYPLMTFSVTAHIHLQALRLWRNRLPFFSKPAPPATEVSR